MQVCRGGPARAARQTDDLAGLDLVALFHEVARLVAVACGETVGVPDDNVVAVAEIRSRLGDHAVEGGHNLVVGLRLDIHTGMTATATSAKGTDDMGTGKRISPMLLGDALQVELEGQVLRQRVFLHIVRVE